VYLREPRTGVRAIGDVYLQTPRGSTRRYGMGDGPITSPDQDPTTGEIIMPDDYVGSGTPPASTFDSSSDQVVATVGPIITGVKNAVTDAADAITSFITGTGSAPAATTPGAASSPAASVSTPSVNIGMIILVTGAGYAAYRYFGKNKRKR